MWAVLIATLSLMPSSDFPKITIPHFDKLVHFSFYFILFLFTAYGWKKQSQYAFLRQSPLFFIWFICMLFGIAIEIGQETFTTTRHFDLEDILANGTGAFFALSIWKFRQFIPLVNILP